MVSPYALTCPLKNRRPKTFKKTLPTIFLREGRHGTLRGGMVTLVLTRAANSGRLVALPPRPREGQRCGPRAPGPGFGRVRKQRLPLLGCGFCTSQRRRVVVAASELEPLSGVRLSTAFPWGRGDRLSVQQLGDSQGSSVSATKVTRGAGGRDDPKGSLARPRPPPSPRPSVRGGGRVVGLSWRRPPRPATPTRRDLGDLLRSTSKVR